MQYNSLGTEIADKDAKYQAEYRRQIVKSASAMSLVLETATESPSPEEALQAAVTSKINEDRGRQSYQDNASGKPEWTGHADRSPQQVSKGLQDTLGRALPIHKTSCSHVLADNSRPSALVRLWLPGLALLVSISLPVGKHERGVLLQEDASLLATQDLALKHNSLIFLSRYLHRCHPVPYSESY